MPIKKSERSLPFHTEITVNPFYDEAHPGFPHMPLLLGSSGGGGHNAAIEALTEYLIKKNLISLATLPEYPADKVSLSPYVRFKISLEKGVLRLGSYLSHSIPGLSNLIRRALHYSPWPILPSNKDILAEKLAFESYPKRQAIDMLLDVFPTGYAYAAIWNLLMRDDQISDLKKLIVLKQIGDKTNHDIVKKYFIHTITTAAKQKKPYTEIISTQAMGLPALCDAVHYCNQLNQTEVPIKIHQYLTEFAIDGASYFFESLKRLSSLQCQQLFLYGIDLDQTILAKFGLEKRPFAGVFNIDPKNNPMVRPGFCQKVLHHIAFTKNIELATYVKNAPDKKMMIYSHEKIATIMLGSQASQDTVEYASIIAQRNYNKVFVFGGTKPHIKEHLVRIQATLPVSFAQKIILLDHQKDNYAAAILTRSQVIIIRAGGLSIMEQVMIPHSKQQALFIHNKQVNGQLTSGIHWEDANAERLIQYLGLQGICVKKTSTQHIHQQLSHIEKSDAPDKFIHFLHNIFPEESSRPFPDPETALA